MSVLDEIQKNFSSPDAPEVTAGQELPVVENTENNITPDNTQTKVIQKDVIVGEPEKQTEVIQEEKKIQFANEELAEANDFISRNPDKSLSDYYSLKKPIDQFSEDDLIKNFLSEKEGMSKDEVDAEIERLELSDEDDDFVDEGELKKLKSEREKMLNDAKQWREDFVSEQLGKSEVKSEESPEAQPTYEERLEDARKTYEAERAEYTQSIYGAISEMTEIPLELNGEIISFKPDEEFLRETRLGSEDLSSIGKAFFENGKIKDPKGFIQETTLWANPATRKPMLDFIIEQAITRDRLQKDKVRRNINFDNLDNGTTPNKSDDTHNAVDRLLNRNKRASF